MYRVPKDKAKLQRIIAVKKHVENGGLFLLKTVGNNAIAKPNEPIPIRTSCHILYHIKVTIHL